MSIKTKAILVVDDTLLVTYHVGCIVERMGFRAVSVSNAAEALERLAEDDFVAVISARFPIA